MVVVANPFERVGLGSHVPTGAEFRRLWRSLPRAERKRVNRYVVQLRQGQTSEEAALFAGRAWQLQTQWAAATIGMSLAGLVLVFLAVGGAPQFAGALGAVLVAPVGYIWHCRRLTAAVTKNACAAAALKRLAATAA